MKQYERMQGSEDYWNTLGSKANSVHGIWPDFWRLALVTVSTWSTSSCTIAVLAPSKLIGHRRTWHHLLDHIQQPTEVLTRGTSDDIGTINVSVLQLLNLDVAPVRGLCCAWGLAGLLEHMQQAAELLALGAGHDVEVVAALCQQRGDGGRGLLGELARHDGALHRRQQLMCQQKGFREALWHGMALQVMYQR